MKSKTEAISDFQIGTMAERSLHAHLKRLYTQPGDCVEEKIAGYFVDIRRGESVIEIQTGSFGNMKKKLGALLPTRPLRIVHPIAVDKWITKLDKDTVTLVTRRKSPKRGTVYCLFDELVSFPHLIHDPNFSIEVVLIQEEEMRCMDGKGSWRRQGTSITDHKLLEVLGREIFEVAKDFLRLLPKNWTGPSTNRELAKELKQPYSRIARMTYCFLKMDLIQKVGKVGNSILFELK